MSNYVPVSTNVNKLAIAGYDSPSQFANYADLHVGNLYNTGIIKHHHCQIFLSWSLFYDPLLQVSNCLKSSCISRATTLSYTHRTTSIDA